MQGLKTIFENSTLGGSEVPGTFDPGHPGNGTMERK
jgi:hypothetical protein